MILVMGARRELSEDDEMMLNLAKDLKLPCIVVLSKTDKLSFSKNEAKDGNDSKAIGLSCPCFLGNGAWFSRTD